MHCTAGGSGPDPPAVGHGPGEHDDDEQAVLACSLLRNLAAHPHPLAFAPEPQLWAALERCTSSGRPTLEDTAKACLEQLRKHLPATAESTPSPAPVHTPGPVEPELQPQLQPGPQGGGSPWTEMRDEKGNAYYYNMQTGVSEWTKPAEMQHQHVPQPQVAHLTPLTEGHPTQQPVQHGHTVASERGQQGEARGAVLHGPSADKGHGDPLAHPASTPGRSLVLEGHSAALNEHQHDPNHPHQLPHPAQPGSGSGSATAADVATAAALAQVQVCMCACACGCMCGCVCQRGRDILLAR